MDNNQNGFQGNNPQQQYAQQPNQAYQQNPQFQQMNNQQFNGGNYQQPLEQPKQKKPIYKKWWFWVIIVIVIIGIVGGAGSSSSDSEKKSSNGETSVTADVSDKSKEDSQTEEKITAGNSVDLDGLKITYVSCDTDFKKYNEFADVKSGNKVIRAEFLYENNSERDVSLEGFDCYADNDKCEEFYSVDDYASPTLESLSKGRKFKGVVYYEVPKDAKVIELECETEFWSNDKITFVVQ